MNAYDIETFNDEHNNYIPYCICFLFLNIQHVFYYKTKDLVIESLDFIFALNFKKEVVYIHNLNFDGLIILNSLSYQKKFKFTSFIRDLNLYEITVFLDDKILIFKCSYKLLPSSLTLIAKNFQLGEKMIFPYDFSSLKNLNYKGPTPSEKFFKNKEDFLFFYSKTSFFDFKEYSIKYCMNDVIITSKFVEILNNIIKKYEITLKDVYSAPSLSLKIFQKKFNNNKISLNNSLLNDRLIRPSYYGGRCEVYGNPFKNEYVYHFDFSGMYGQCMREKFCYGNYKIKENNFNLSEPGFYCIEYESQMEIPVLPHHKISNGKLMFTNGVLKGVYWFEEIKLFLEMGGIVKKISYAVIYENFDYIFNEFVDYFTKIREESDSHKIFGKLIINGLYGRLGMNFIDNYSFFIKKEELEFYEKKITILSKIYLNDIILIKTEIDENLKKIINKKVIKTKNNINIAASITSKARIKLYKAQQSVIAHEGRILYSDTDSIFASYKKKILNENHGEIFWDGSKSDTVVQDAVFISPKTYALKYSDHEIVKNKGFAQNSVSFENIKKNFYSNDNMFLYNLTYINKKNLKLRKELYNKKITLNFYDKRKFNENKKKTEAFEYSNFEYF